MLLHCFHSGGNPNSARILTFPPLQDIFGFAFFFNSKRDHVTLSKPSLFLCAEAPRGSGGPLGTMAMVMNRRQGWRKPLLGMCSWISQGTHVVMGSACGHGVCVCVFMALPGHMVMGSLCVYGSHRGCGHGVHGPRGRATTDKASPC
jgi:hypothetical protein